MKKSKFFLLVAAAACLVACSGKKGGGMNFGDNEFPVQTVGTSSANSETTYPASIKGVQDVEIRPKISGFITRINVREGQSVSADQVLFVLDNETYQAAVRQAEASVNQAKAAISTAEAQLATAKLTYDNSTELHKNGVIGDYELQAARNTYNSAQAQVNQAQAALQQAQAGLSSARENLSFCYVKSPSSGVVGSLPYKVGALVSAQSNPALTTISNISTTEVYFSVNEKDILEMTKNSGGMNAAVNSFPPLRLKLADGSIYPYQGRVVKVSGVIDSGTGSASMIAQFPNPEHLLKSGGSGSIIVPRENSSAIVLPQACVSEVQDKKFVYTVGADNKVKYTEITVSPQNDGVNYVVTSGLNVGDKYVTNGLTKLSDGMEIVPITPEQYQKKINESGKIGTDGTAKGFVDAMTGKEK
ncbi:MAG: efflux RND transporter periplasmic adaptor subunit [Prevotella sp.]|nr:efflux RND transporter periplasmic adaptor subunit [Prevotella sp.]